MRHWRRAGEGHAQRIQPQAGEDFVPDSFADDRQAEQKIQAFCRNLAVDAHLEFGPDSRHTEQRGRSCATQVVEKGVEAFSEEHCLAGVNRCQFNEHPLSDMAQRQVGQQAVRLIEAE